MSNAALPPEFRLAVHVTLRFGASATQFAGIVPKETGAENVSSTLLATGGLLEALLVVVARKITVPPSGTLVLTGKPKVATLAATSAVPVPAFT
jgi:hypothetical protein